ncbi:hypothetical protein AB47_3310 [Escherichia coli 3-373-03_S1_C2]|nr:hypothetical protein AB47_3310 [Escherichia coli 3-373-03_S1_C2]
MYPDAHEKARKHDVMSYLARIAQNYKDENYPAEAGFL